MGMGGGAFGAMTQALQGTMQNSPNYVDRRGLYGPDGRPIGSTGSMGGMMGPQNATYANTTPNLSGSLLRGGGIDPQTGAIPETLPYRPSASPYQVNTGSISPGGVGSSGMPTSGGGGSGSGGPFPLQGQYGIVKMAGGGLAGAAQTMADKGRNGDSMLVHMSPGEVKGLQQLAMAQGGSLSINPDTGLPEAFRLKNFLPMIAGAALSPFVTPMGAAAIVGGFEGIRSGDISKGLMAGLGAYGGAGLMGGLSSAGSASIAEQGGTAAVNELGSQATNLTADQLKNLSAEQLQGLKSVSESGMYNTADILKTANAANTQVGAQNLLGANTLPNLNATQLQAYNDTLASGAYNPSEVIRSAGAQNAVSGATGMQNVGAGFNQLGSEAGRSAVYNALPTGTIPAAVGTTAMAMMPEEATSAPAIPGLDEKYKRPPYSYELSPDFQGYTPRQPKPYYRPRGLGYADGGMTYDDEPGMDMAAGGIAGYRSGGLKIGEGIATDSDPETSSLGARDAGLKRREKNFAAANLKPVPMPKTNLSKLGEIKTGIAAAAGGGSIGGYSDGGRMLKGPGDGMSDSIPAVIGKRQPARLADGEFVVPADVVSHLGNGSTDAGAKKLYSMMDKIRTARTGRKKQAPAVKADKYLPK